MSTILPLTAAASCVFAAGAVLYSKIRPRFSVRVNCWFCQGDFVVRYEEQNSWDCPHCEQYNGFLQDGDYNKIIAAQYTESLNPQSLPKSRRDPKINADDKGSLCNSCAINQQFKIRQLASFVPTREECFDQEIRAYQAHLERVYRLCQGCSGLLEEKLSKEESWLKPKLLQWKLELSRRAGPSAEMVNRLSRMSSVVLNVVEPLVSLLTVVLVLLTSANVEDSSFGQYLRENGLHYELGPVLDYLVVIPLLAALCIAARLMAGPQRVAAVVLNLLRAGFWFLACCGSDWSMQLCSISLVIVLLLAAVWVERSPRLEKAFLHTKPTSTSPVYSNQRNLDTSSVYSTPRRDLPRPSASDLDTSIEKLNISPEPNCMSPLHSFSESPSSVCSSAVRKRPLVSPSRLDRSAFKVPSSSNLTKTSWVAGGYWQNTYVPSASPLFRLSRSSSQSSGIGSIRSGHRGHFSPPGSRPGSTCGELDCFSLCSEEPDSPDSNEAQFAAARAQTPHKWDTTAAPVSYTWGAVIFLLGFSLAVNVCVGAYLYIR